MESLGIVRKIDETGRIVLPKDFRRRLALEPNADAVELFADGDQIIIRKYAARCIFCGSSDNTIEFPASESAKTALRDSAKSFDCKANNNTERKIRRMFFRRIFYILFTASL